VDHYNLDQWSSKSLKELIVQLSDPGNNYYDFMTKDNGYFINIVAKMIIKERNNAKRRKN